MVFETGNTAGYTPAERKALNAEFEALAASNGWTGDGLVREAKAFADAVATRPVGENAAEQAALVAEVDALLADVLADIDGCGDTPDFARTARAIRRCDSWGDIAAAARLDGLTGLADQLRLAEANWWELQP